MPNTPALVGEGMSAISLNEEIIKPENKEIVSDIISIFESFGISEGEITREDVHSGTLSRTVGSQKTHNFSLIHVDGDAFYNGAHAVFLNQVGTI